MSSAPDLFDRAVALARQRAQILAWADDPNTPTQKTTRAPSTRRQLLNRARAVERIIVGIGESAVFDCRMSFAPGAKKEPDWITDLHGVATGDDKPRHFVTRERINALADEIRRAGEFARTIDPKPRDAISYPAMCGGLQSVLTAFVREFSDHAGSDVVMAKAFADAYRQPEQNKDTPE